MVMFVAGAAVALFTYPVWLTTILLGRGQDPDIIGWLLCTSATANLLMLGGMAMETIKAKRKG